VAKKGLFIFLGILSLVIGIIGAFLPVLPTTPFILLAAFLFARSSETLYNKLANNKYFGETVVNFRENKIISKKTKAISLISMWIFIIFSIYIIPLIIIKLLVFVLGLIGTFFITRFPSTKINNKS